MKKYIISLLLACFFLLSANGVPEKPRQAQLVNDFAKVLSPQQKQALERKLVAFDSKTSTQIAVVTVKDLEGHSAIDMATRIMEKWGVGGSKDNGIVLVFKPKTASSNGQVAITTGYGVEHLVTDALAKQIVEYELIPRFKQGDIYGGFNEGTNVLMSLTAGEFTGTDYLAQQKSGSRPNYFFVLIIIVYVLSRLGRSRGAHGMSSGGSSLPFWLLMGMGGGSRHSGSFGDFSSGGGSFGGFGGGMGGGGGAGGSW